ncbi:hypothetical protein, conserved [Plasmodium gonderi]|uniref:Uncharacterized protein n=1 Tax=Plasmodium gonderi TaxID=77519 RepID=A0A1Y1JL17_PLAGO|nr:hypothetical protein, conserved [Plasmodium gonderi]GAW81492.1 hypothetical protein, conserved [Plasmodium gonderi]
MNSCTNTVYIREFVGSPLVMRRTFARKVEERMKPSDIRIKSDKPNFNDIIVKYFPNAKLKKKNGGALHGDSQTCRSTDEVKYYLSSKMKRKMELLSTETKKHHGLEESRRRNCLPINSVNNNKTSPENISKNIPVANGESDVLSPCMNNESDGEILEISKEDYEIQKYKNKLHKRIWITLKRNNEKDFEKLYEELKMYHLKDEVSYSILLHGKLIISKGDKIKDCFQLIDEMKLKKVHHSLIRFNERLLYSYYELSKLNARPSTKQWVKILRTVWFTSALIKARRQKFILRNLSKIKKIKGDNNSTSLANFNNIFNIHNLHALYAQHRDPLLGGGARHMFF